jgi:GxxExxY protein
MRQLNINENTSSLDINNIAREIIGAAINVHRILGLGLQSTTYKACLKHELDECGLNYEENVEFPLFYKNRFIDTGVSVNLVVENKIIIDVQTLQYISEEHVLTVLNQLRHTEISLGLIINFNSKYIKGDSIKRVINGYNH